jgi:dipeptidyl aminopeptidase/acylaminoacyl peptidase
MHKICIFGASYGGYAALMASVQAPDLYKCTIGYAGIYDLNMMYTDGDIPQQWSGTGYLERVIGRDEKELNKFSPIHLKADIMLIQGTQDN